MRLVTKLMFRMKAIARWGRMSEELGEEMAFHIEKQTEKYVANGKSEKEARRQALRDFGGVLSQRENAQASWGVGWVQDVKSDVKYTIRQLRRNPTFAAVAVFTLALGIGGTTAVFSVVNGVLLEPLPFRNSQELVGVHHTMPEIDVDEAPLSPALYLTFRDHSRTLVDIAVWQRSSVTVTGLAEPEQVEAALVTDGLFPLLGVSPLLGRVYNAAEVAPGSPSPVILSFGYWVRRFGSDRDVLGQSIRIDGNDLTIIGVMPGGLQVGELHPDLFLPLVFDRARVGVGNFSFPGIARLRPNTPVVDASRDLDRLTVLATEEYGGGGIPLSELESRGFGTFVRPLKQDVVGEASTIIWVVFGTVGLVLIVACTNVANLFLVRAESRQREVSLRLAMGASKGRLARQFLTESLLIGVLGGAAGLALALGGITLLVQMAPPQLPRLDNIAANSATLLVALGLSMLAGVLFGVVPIFCRGRGALAEPLKDGGRGSGGGRRNRMQAVFAVSQVALALVLLIASGLMIRSFQGLRSVPPGFERPHEVLTVRVSVPSSEARTAIEAVRTHQQILDQIAQLPGVTSVSATASVAMDNWESWENLDVEGFPLEDGVASPHRRMNWITPNYFATMQNPILAGRSVDWADVLEMRQVAVVTENFAREYWGDPLRAIGGRIRSSSSAPWREIVGVVGDVHTRGVGVEPPAVVYWPILMDTFWGRPNFVIRDLRYAVRTTMPNPRGLLPQVRDVVWSVNSNLPLAQIRTLDEILAASMARTSFTLVLLAIAAAMSLVLGTVGVYGVISYGVAQRTREMGIRMAIGARREDVRGLVLRQGAVLGLIGVLVGMVAAAGLTQLMSSLLFGVSPIDPATYGALSLILLGVVLLASFVPARRAAAVDATEALRWE